MPLFFQFCQFWHHSFLLEQLEFHTKRETNDIPQLDAAIAKKIKKVEVAGAAFIKSGDRLGPFLLARAEMPCQLLSHKHIDSEPGREPIIVVGISAGQITPETASHHGVQVEAT